MTKSSDHQDFSAPQRPKLWLLRTRRFWFGIGILLFLLFLWLGSIYLRMGFQHNGVVWGPEIKNQRSFQGLSYAEGSIYFTRSNMRWWDPEDLSKPLPKFSPKPPSWFWSNGKALYDSRMFPKLYTESHSRERNIGIETEDIVTRIALPLWLPVLLWLIIWPLWIRRITRKEAAHFAKLQ